MKLSMKDFRALMENDLTRGPEPKLVGPAPAAPSKDDKLNANDSKYKEYLDLLIEKYK